MSTNKHRLDSLTTPDEHGFPMLGEKRRHERTTTNPARNMLLRGEMGCGMRVIGIAGLNLPQSHL